MIEDKHLSAGQRNMTWQTNRAEGRHPDLGGYVFPRPSPTSANVRHFHLYICWYVDSLMAEICNDNGCSTVETPHLSGYISSCWMLNEMYRNINQNAASLVNLFIVILIQGHYQKVEAGCIPNIYRNSFAVCICKSCPLYVSSGIICDLLPSANWVTSFSQNLPSCQGEINKLKQLLLVKRHPSMGIIKIFPLVHSILKTDTLLLIKLILSLYFANHHWKVGHHHHLYLWFRVKVTL